MPYEIKTNNIKVYQNDGTISPVEAFRGQKGQQGERGQKGQRGEIGTPGSQYTVLIQNVQPTQETNKLWIKQTPQPEVQIPTMDDLNSAISPIEEVNIAQDLRLTALENKQNVKDIQASGVSIVDNTGVANINAQTVHKALGYTAADNADLDQVRSDISNSIVVYPEMEIGQIAMTPTEVIYSKSTSRIRTPIDKGISVKKGWVLYTNSKKPAKYYVSLKIDEGKYLVNGWIDYTEKYEVPQDGILYILSRFDPEVTITDANSIKFKIAFDANSALSRIENIEKNKYGFDSIISNYSLNYMDLDYVDGYIKGDNGSIDIGTAQEKTSTYIKVCRGDVFDFVSAIKKDKDNWLAIGLYDSNKKFITRVTDFSVLIDDVAGYTYSHIEINIPNDCEYIRVSTRTYGDCFKVLLPKYSPYNEIFSHFLTPIKNIEKNKYGFDSIISNYSLNYMDLDYVDGYVNGYNGGIDIGTAQEKTSTYIKVCKGDVFDFVSAIKKDKNNWLGIGLYDSNKKFITRVTDFSVLIDDVAGYTYSHIEINIPNDCEYIRVSTRTYGDCFKVLLPKYSPYNEIFSHFLTTIKNYTYDEIPLLNTNIRGVNHRGYNVIAPENTLSAFKLSKKNGFDYVETDVSFTSDGVAVCLHDATIDRTSNGTGNIGSMTFAQVRQYDFGSWKSPAYANEKIPSFEEFILLCKNIGLHPYIELKSNSNYTREQIESLCRMVKRHGMSGQVTWISFNATFLGYVKNYDDYARLGYIVGDATSENVSTALSLKTENNYVFLDVSGITDSVVEICIDESLPVEIWTVNSESTIKGLDAYITGVTSDSLNASRILLDANL